jgi:two-component system response regulator ResD
VRVLVVDDDPTVVDVLSRYLHRAGFDVGTAAAGGTALAEFTARPPDLVVLDLMLPDIDGIVVCRRMRAFRPVPIVMLTALGEESDRILGLETGADDYVTKPFSPRELVLRVQSVLRRAAPRVVDVRAAPDVLRCGAVEVDLAAREARKRGRPLALTGREFDLLAFLLAHPRRAFSRAELMREVWGWEYGDQSTVTVHIRRLREKVEDNPADPTHLVTVWGVGYRLETAPGPPPQPALSARPDALRGLS